MENDFESYIHTRNMYAKPLGKVCVFRFGVMLFTADTMVLAQEIRNLMINNFTPPRSASLKCSECGMNLDSRAHKEYHTFSSDGCRAIPRALGAFNHPYISLVFYIDTKAKEVLEVLAFLKEEEVAIFDPMTLHYGLPSVNGTGEEKNYERSKISTLHEKLRNGELCNSEKREDLKKRFLNFVSLKLKWLEQGKAGDDGSVVYNRHESFRDGILPQILHVPFVVKLQDLGGLYE